MPIYEYCCPSCDFKFELLRPASQSNAGASCPKCKKTADRVLSCFCSVSKDSSGVTAPIGGSSCGSCGSSSCSTCGH